MSMKETILDLYFNKHLKQKEIANQVGTSQQYISKIIKTDERYNEEKRGGDIYGKNSKCICTCRT